MILPVQWALLDTVRLVAVLAAAEQAHPGEGSGGSTDSYISLNVI